MGRKSKSVAKKDKEEEEPVEDKHTSSHTKPIKKAKKSIEVFTPKFYSTIDNFQNFYREVLELKSEATGTDVETELDEVRKKVSEKLENQSSKILSDELVSLEEWISQQQKDVLGEINKIQEALKNNETTLKESGAFNQAEVNKQLQPIQKKIDDKQKIYDNYSELLKRAAQVSSA